MAAPKIDPEHKLKARESGAAVFQLYIDRSTKTPKGGKFGLSGVLPPPCEKALMRMVHGWLKKGLI